MQFSPAPDEQSHWSVIEIVYNRLVTQHRYNSLGHRTINSDLWKIVYSGHCGVIALEVPRVCPSPVSICRSRMQRDMTAPKINRASVIESFNVFAASASTCTSECVNDRVAWEIVASVHTCRFSIHFFPIVVPSRTSSADVCSFTRRTLSEFTMRGVSYSRIRNFPGFGS